MTSIRIVCMDFYMSSPVQGLDVLNSDFRGSPVAKVPVIRIFGSTNDGHKACLHVHGVFPYIYIPYDGTENPNGVAYQIASALDRSINISMGQSSSNQQHVYKISLVSAFPFYGFHGREHQFFKIMFYNPMMSKKACTLLENGCVLNKIFQPHESHIPYHQQFMIDYNLHGMNFIRLSRVRYRSDFVTVSVIPEGAIVLSDVNKLSVCKLEMDASAEDILNRLDISQGKVTANPGIQYICEDEKRRRRLKGADTQILPCLTQNRVKANPTVSQVKYRQLLQTKLEGEVRDAEPCANSSVYAAETPDSQSILSASSVLDVSYLDISHLGATLTNLDATLTNLDVSMVLDEDADLLMGMLLENREDAEEGSILSQVTKNEDDNENDLDLTMPLASITTPLKDLLGTTEEDEDGIWNDSFFSDVQLVPEINHGIAGSKEVPQTDGPGDSSSEDDVVVAKPRRKRRPPCSPFPALNVTVTSPKKSQKKVCRDENECGVQSSSRVRTLKTIPPTAIQPADLSLGNEIMESGVKRKLRFADLDIRPLDETMVQEIVVCRYTPSKAPRRSLRNQSAHEKTGKMVIIEKPVVRENIQDQGLNNEKQFKNVVDEDGHLCDNYNDKNLCTMDASNKSRLVKTNTSLIHSSSLENIPDGHCKSNQNETYQCLPTKTTNEDKQYKEVMNEDPEEDYKSIGCAKETEPCVSDDEGLSSNKNVKSLHARVENDESPDTDEGSCDIFTPETSKNACALEAISVVDKYDIESKFVPIAGPSRVTASKSLTTSALENTQSSVYSNETTSSILTPYQKVTETPLSLNSNVSEASSSSDLLTPYQRDITVLPRNTEISMRDQLDYKDDSEMVSEVNSQRSRKSNIDKCELGSKIMSERSQNSDIDMNIDKNNDKTVSYEINEKFSTNLKQTSDGLYILAPKYNPPSRKLIESTMQAHGIPLARSEGPFYGNVLHVTGPVEVGHKVLKIPSKTTLDLEEFEATHKGLAEYQRDEVKRLYPDIKGGDIAKIQLSHADNKIRTITPVSLPPTRREVELWVLAKGIREEQRSEELQPKKERIRKVVRYTENDGSSDSEMSLTLSPCTPTQTQLEQLDCTHLEAIGLQNSRLVSTDLKQAARFNETIAENTIHVRNEKLTDASVKMDKDLGARHLREFRTFDKMMAENVLQLQQQRKQELLTGLSVKSSTNIATDLSIKTSGDIVTDLGERCSSDSGRFDVNIVENLLQAQCQSNEQVLEGPSIKMNAVFAQANDKTNTNLLTDSICKINKHSLQDSMCDASKHLLTNSIINSRNLRDLNIKINERHFVDLQHVTSQRCATDSCSNANDQTKSESNKISHSDSSHKFKISSSPTNENLLINEGNLTNGDSKEDTTNKIPSDTHDNTFLRNILQQSHLFHPTSDSINNSHAITGTTLNNTHGFKMTLQNFQEAAQRIEYQYLTTMVVEVHVQTRTDFKPDPQHDAIRAVFYSILRDAPNAQVITGILVVNVQNISPSKKSGFKVLDGTGVTSNVTYVDSESDLYVKFLELFNMWDPDVLIGYEIEMLSWGYLVDRGYTLGVNCLLKMSRIHDEVPYKRQDEESHAELKVTGRIILDLWRLMRYEIALTSYTLENVAYHVLHERAPLHSTKDLTNWWQHRCSKIRQRTTNFYLYRVRAVLKLVDHFDLIGRTSELARLFGILFYEVLSRGSQFRVESMMLRLAKPMNYIPVSPSVSQRAKMRAPEYLPLILEPESKFYTDPVIVLDFQSLYPSMIIAYNYCFSTCIGRVEHLGTNQPFEFGATHLKISKARVEQLLKRQQLNFSPCGAAFVTKDVRHGILPRMLQEILDTRLLVKKAMKEERSNKTLQRILHSRQLGLKLIANVTYGYSAANFSGRMPAVEIADSVVAKGRETLQRAITMVETNAEWGARVVYGDTDSLFVLVPGKSRDHAFKIGTEIAEAVTNDNPSPVRLKLEKIYQPCILQTKKRYVGYMYEAPEQVKPDFDAKGIETVRRDGCPAVSKMLEKCLRLLFETKNVSLVRTYVTRQFHKLMAGRVSIQDLTFAKEYRGMSGYKPGACVPALELARKWKNVDKRNEPRSGERVPYVIINGPPGLPLIRLVRSPRELLEDQNLRPNALYYVTKVIIPPINRCFLLLGADLQAWFNEMPRKQIQYLPTSSPSKGKKTTISQYFATTSCACCGQQTKEGLCIKCQKDTQFSAVILHEKVRVWERNYFDTKKICQSCCGRSNDINCISLDCPVLYHIKQTAKDLQQSAFVRDLIDKLPKLEF